MKAIILAAGKGTRMQTDGEMKAKVMRTINGKPMIEYVLEAISFIAKEDIIIVVGYKREEIYERYAGYTYAIQEEQLGTGDAVKSAESALIGYKGAVLVCYGDMPGLSRETYEKMIREHKNGSNECTILTSETEKDLSYGRIVRDKNGEYVETVEERDCTTEQKEIREVNVGVYVFGSEELRNALKELKNENAQGEYYLTDVPGIIQRHGGKVGISRQEIGNEIIGANTPKQLEQLEELLRNET